MSDKQLGSADAATENPDPGASDRHDALHLDDPQPTVDRRVDIAVAAGGSVLGLVLIISSRDIPRGSVSDAIGSNGLAVSLGGFLVLGGLLIITRRLLAWRRSDHRVPVEGTEDELGLPASAARSFLMWLAGLGWVFMLPRVGFIVSAYLLAVVGLFAMGARTKVKLGIVPVVFSIVLWVLFSRVFGVQYPAGPVDLFFADLIPPISL